MSSETSQGAPPRVDGRAANALRPVTIEIDPLKFAEGSVLISAGDTRVLVAASVEKRVPGFLAGSGKGWLTAEYAMLPRATMTRTAREVSQGRPSGRSASAEANPFRCASGGAAPPGAAPAGAGPSGR